MGLAAEMMAEFTHGGGLLLAMADTDAAGNICRRGPDTLLAGFLVDEDAIAYHGTVPSPRAHRVKDIKKDGDEWVVYVASDSYRLIIGPLWNDAQTAEVAAVPAEAKALLARKMVEAFNAARG